MQAQQPKEQLIRLNTASFALLLVQGKWVVTKVQGANVYHLLQTRDFNEAKSFFDSAVQVMKEIEA